MADKATVQLTVDTKDFLKNLTKAIDTIGVASEEVRDLSKDFTSAFTVSDGKVKQLKNSIAAMIAAGNNSGDAFDGLVAELKAAQAQSDNLKNALKEVDKLVVSPEIDDKGIKSFKEELTGAFESLKGGDAGGALSGLTSGFAAAFPVVGSLSAGMEVFSSTIGAVAGAFGDAFAAGAEFDKTLKQLSISTGLAGEDLGKLETAADNAFLKGVGESAAEAAKIVGSLRQTLGDAIPLDSLDEAAARSNQVAQALGTETPELVGKLSPLIKQYGLSFNDALNLVASGAQKGVTDIGGYLDAIQEFTPNLKEAGFSAEEFTGLLGKAGEVGLKDFAKVGDGIKELQNRIKSGDLLTQLQGIGGETSKQLENLARQAQKGTLSGKEVLTQSIAEIDKAFKDGKISQSLRGQLLTTFGGSIAEDIGSEAYSKIFSAPIDTAAVKKAAQEAGKVIDQTIPPPDFGRIFELAKKEVGQALNTIYKDLIVPIINPVIEGFGKVRDVIAGAFSGLGGDTNILKTLGNVIGTIVNVAINGFVLALKTVFTVVRVLFAPIQILISAFVKLVKWIGDVTGASEFLTKAWNYLKSLGETVFTVITNLGDAIVGLVNAVSSFDLSNIQNALSAFGTLTEAKKKDADATKEQAKAQEDVNKANNGGLTPEEAAKLAEQQAAAAEKKKEQEKAYADALKAAQAELKALTAEEQKRQQIRDAQSIEDENKRAIKIIEIERDFQKKILDEQLAAIKGKGKLETTQREIFNIQLKKLEQESADAIAQIRAKQRADELAKAQEQAKKVEELNAKVADQLLARLQARFAGGDNSLATAVLNAQRSAIERGLTATVDAIIASTPEYAAAIAKINKEIEQGLLNPADYAERTNKVRAEILARLQSLPSDTKDVYALQIRAAYQQSADEIAKGTADIVAQIRQQQVKQAGEIFADSLRGIGEALRSVDFATIYGEAADKAAALNEEQEKLIENLQDGTATYQESVHQLANLQSQQEQTASATATAISQAFQAIADQQAKAAQDGINTVNAALERRKEIAKQEIDLEKLKAAEVKALQDQGIKDKEVYEAALKAIEEKYTQDRANLKKEDEKLAKESAEVQDAALNQIAVSAGAAFASLVAGGESAGEALKKVVGSTVSALLDLYTPSIVALFSSVIPPPFGQIAGLAAVQALKALLQSALSGFEEGGYTGNGGTKQVAGVVHGQEFVMTADTTRKNRALLEHLHSGKSLESFPALQKMLADNQISTIPVTELQLMRSELSAIRQRLDSMPNGIQGNMGVDVQVGMDTYLYERDRSRMIARKLRG